MEQTWWSNDRAPVELAAEADGDEFDVVIVGAGVVGLSCAIMVAERGHRVLVLEAHATAGQSTTVRSTGKLSLLQGTRLTSIVNGGGRQAAVDYLTGLRAGLAFLTTVAGAEGVALERRRAATFAETHEQLKAARDEYEIASSLGLNVQWEDLPDLGVPALGAATLPDQIQVNPHELIDGLAARAMAEGAQIVGNRRVQSVKAADSHVVVSAADDQVFRAAHVVVASGSPMVNRACAFAATSASRTSMLVFDPGPESDMLISAGKPAHSVRDAAGSSGRALVVAGEAWSVGEPLGPRASRDALRQWAAERWQGLSEAAEWSAQDYLPVDGQVLVGHVVGQPRVHVATGLAKWGLVAGVAAAQTIVRGMGGDHEPVVPAASLVKAIPGLLALNARTGGRLASGWLAHHDEPVCTHLGGRLVWNPVEESWDCPLHGSRFDADGSVLEGPAVRPIAARRP